MTASDFHKTLRTLTEQQQENNASFRINDLIQKINVDKAVAQEHLHTLETLGLIESLSPMFRPLWGKRPSSIRRLARDERGGWCIGMPIFEILPWPASKLLRDSRGLMQSALVQPSRCAAILTDPCSLAFVAATLSPIRSEPE